MYKKIGKYLAALLLGAICLFAFGCVGGAGGNSSSISSSSEEEVTQTIVLSETEMSLGVDETKTLQVLFSEEELAIEWSSSNAKIASVDNGAVTGLSAGTVKITAKTGGKALTCTVTVVFEYENAPYVTLPNELEAEDGTYALRLLVGDSYTLAPALTSDNGNLNFDFTLTSEADEISLSSLTITALEAVKNAPVKVTCSYENVEYSLTVYVTVVAE